MREIYLDYAATTPMAPEALTAMVAYEESGRGNPYRGLHVRAERATIALEESRKTVAEFIGASADELIFTKGTTEGLNMLAHGLARDLGPGDEVVLTLLEHHANLLPWRALAQERGFSIRFIPLNRKGGIDREIAEKVINEKTKVVSNVLGSILPVKEIADSAHRVGAVLIVDAAQSVGHLDIDVRNLSVDALAFGAHKMYGPMGIGALYATKELQGRLVPLLFGGGMVEEVFDDGCAVFAGDVRKFEAGTPNVTGAIGFAEACRVLDIPREHEEMLTAKLIGGLRKIEGMTMYGPDAGGDRIGVVSFSMKNMHPHDVAQALSEKGICVRAGFHCAAPLARCLHPDGTVRVSIGRETTEEEITRFLYEFAELA